MAPAEPDDQSDAQSSGFELLFEHTSDCIVEGSIQDGKPIVHRVNDAFEGVFGYTTSELRGENLNDFITPDGKRDEVEVVDQEIREGDIGPREVTRQTADGPRDFLLRATGGKGELHYAIYTDITAKKERERKLEELTTRLELALKETDTGVWEWDLDTDEVYWDETSERLFGYETGEFPDEFAGFADRVPESDLQRIQEKVDHAVETGEQYRAEFRVTPHTENQRWIQARGVVEYDDEGDPERLLGIQTDITERKEREEELEETKRTLEQSNEKLDQFASMVSHDLRNPLNVIKGRTELLRPEAPEEHVEPIERSAERMETIIDDLLTLSRAGKSVDDPESISLAAVVADSWTAISSDDVKLDVDIPDDVEVEADGDRLRHVFENLFRNAGEHNEPPVTIRVGMLSAETEPASGFFIADDGAGVPESDREEVFEYGYTTNTDGTGFGLSIVEEIVEAHGWKIRVMDDASGGAQFEITAVEFVE